MSQNGDEIDNENYVILVDVDNKNDTMDKWTELFNTNHKTPTLKTPTATTANNGLHYLFKLPEDQFRNLQKLILD